MISLPSAVNAPSLTPKVIVQELDKYIIGQAKAKRAVAIALRNRLRRQRVAKELQKEITPKNIILIGATGIGKTEIARRLATLSGAPFIKVEATKFTEAGYVGREVDSIIRDLVTLAINAQKEKAKAAARPKAEEAVEEMLLQQLLPAPPVTEETVEDKAHQQASFERTKKKLRQRLRAGEFDDKSIEIVVPPTSESWSAFPFDFSFKDGFTSESMEGMNEMLKHLRSLFGRTQGNQRSHLTVTEARRVLLPVMLEKLLDMKKLTQAALEQTENLGIVFFDEIDKIISRPGPTQGAAVSREGVQRDILPLVEGCAVNTKYGMVKTDHILFIAAGAFHSSSPSELIPELQGRFPIRVQLSALSAQDLEHILTKPKNALVKQYQALMKTDGCTLSFDPEALSELARLASEVNAKTHNIGARRLATVMEKLLEDFLFEVPSTPKKVHLTKALVQKKLSKLIEDQDLSRYIL